MRADWKTNNSEKLILFFTGWAMDQNPTAHLADSEWDICTYYDYRDFEKLDFTKLKTYKEIILIAWSTGVWAANKVLKNKPLPISKAIAINGTPLIVDDIYGIPVNIFRGTYQNLNEVTMQKFYKRMTGVTSSYQTFANHLPQRSIGEQKEELNVILNSPIDTNKFIEWDVAYLSKNDAIIPFENQLNYWKERTVTIVIDAPHYPFFILKKWKDLIKSTR